MPLLSELIDVTVADDTIAAHAFAAPESNQENAAPAKRKGGSRKPSSKRFTKAPKKRTSPSGATTKSSVSTIVRKETKRIPLKDEANVRCADDTEEVDEFAEHTDSEVALPDKKDAEEGRPSKSKKAPKAAKLPLKSPSRKEKDGEFEYTPKAARTSKNIGKRPAVDEAGDKKGGDSKRRREGAPTSVLDRHVDGAEDFVHAPLRSRGHCLPVMGSRHRGYTRSRAGSHSDTERGTSDPALRRKLGDVTRKLDHLTIKYNQLREVGIKEAEANYERLKTQAEARSRTANDLITSLRRDIATQKALLSSTTSVQDQIAVRDAELSKARALVDQLSASLSEAQNDNKALSSKLASSRSAVASMESLAASTRTPARANGRPGPPGVSSEAAAHAARVAQMKEDLYSDLTGLLMRNVDIGAESDVYDCLQTGRNGTLHFKLSIAKEPPPTTTTTTNDADDTTHIPFDETEFQYTPRLDSDRDRDLISILPEYLTDEIAFSRTNAAMFYTRVVDTLMKRPQQQQQQAVDEEEEGEESDE